MWWAHWDVSETIMELKPEVGPVPRIFFLIPNESLDIKINTSTRILKASDFTIPVEFYLKGSFFSCQASYYLYINICPMRPPQPLPQTKWFPINAFNVSNTSQPVEYIWSTIV